MKQFDPTFRFKQFAVSDRRCGMKVGTDGVLLGAWAQAPVTTDKLKILDVGTGCGVIALMMAQRYADARITAVEVNHEAIADASDNIAASQWADRISIVDSDFRDIEGSFDLIVSNPPFFVNGESAPDSSRAMARHATGLSPLTLIQWGVEHLNENGKLALIAPVELSDDIAVQAVFSRMTIVRRVDVITSKRRGIARTLWEFSPAASGPTSANEKGLLEVNSPEYIEITKDFYLHF